ncbi:hypothetical protein B1H10_04895 [candidate division KSB1 bacterium 4484_188]|nr:MAG: hypothetical protein B1H10_04895 [candidate division KSB1 bacterium 4484_188]HFE64667.1 hypothetical protein [Caldithrix sp.]
MFHKLPKHRKFDYTPLFYDPEKEEREGHPRIQFRHLRHKRKTRPYIWLIALLAFVIYLLIMLSKIASNY